jgi:hypothetical protein
MPSKEQRPRQRAGVPAPHNQTGKSEATLARGLPILNRGWSCCLLLTGWNEMIGYEILVGHLCGGARGARFEARALSGAERGGHFDDKTGEIIGHSHLDHCGADLIVGDLPVFQIGFADGLADNGGGFGVIEIALSMEFLGLLAAEVEAQQGCSGELSDVASRNHDQGEALQDHPKPHGGGHWG